jgi:acyl carrier protein
MRPKTEIRGRGRVTPVCRPDQILDEPIGSLHLVPTNCYNPFFNALPWVGLRPLTAAGSVARFATPQFREKKMESDNVRTTVKQAIAQVSKLHPDKIPDQASLDEDLGLDSLSIIEIVVEIQLRFKIPDPPDDELPKVRTIDDAVRLVQQHLSLEAI